MKLRIQEIAVVTGHKGVVGVLVVVCRQVGQEVDRVGLHPADLAGEEREGIYANAQSASPSERL